MKYILCLLAVLLAFNASTAERTILFTAAAPSVPGISADEQRRLFVGTITISLDDSETPFLEQAGGWGQGRLVPVWKTNAAGLTIDAQGLPTTISSQFQLDKYLVDWLGVTFRDTQGSLVTQSFVSPATPARPAFPFTASAAKVGEYYWYEADAVRVVDIGHRTAFLSPGYAVEFRRCDMHVAYYGLYRSRSNPYPTSSGRTDFGLELTPTRTLPLATCDGGHFGVIVAGTPKVGYVFAGRDCLVEGAPNQDPYLLSGVQVVVPQAYLQADQRIGWPVYLSQTTSVVYTADPGRTLPPSTLREPHFSTFNRLLGSQADVLDLVTVPANRSEVDGQNVDELINAVTVARAGANSQSNADEVTATLANGEYLKFQDGKLATIPQDTYTDPDLDGLRSSVENGLLDVAAVGLQTSIDLVEQVAPVTQEPQTADTAALLDAIAEVEAKMYEQTPTSLPLGRRYPSRYAGMHPAGWLPSYLEGSPSPGHGTNPIVPLPQNVVTGAPSYDLNGDGSVDRFGTTDPYQNGFNQIILKWAVTASGFRLSDYNKNATKCAFAVYAQNDRRPDQRKLLFVGHDGIIYVSKKDRWTGVNYHSFSLASLVEGTGQTDTYRFALRYQGAAPVDVTPEPPTTPTTNVVTWEDYAPVTLADGVVINVLRETGTETVYLYPDLEDEQTLLTASFSDPAFVPRATTGRPVMAAHYVRTVTPYQIVGSVSTPLPPISTNVYYPAEFLPENIEPEESTVVPSYENSFMWDYTMDGSYPFNYRRGYKFPRGIKAVMLNHNEVIARFGGDTPMMAKDELVDSGGIDFTLRWQPPAVTDLNPTPEVFMANNIQAYRSGTNTFELLSGAGTFLYKGKWITAASETHLRKLLRDMWEWDMFQPRTVYAILHVDGNASKPLLNSVRAPTASTARELNDINNGVLARDLAQGGGANSNANAQRRAELMKSQWFIFSAAKGREHEIEMALRTPRETKLYCVEWDDFREVQKKFAGYNVTYVFDDETERKIIGELQTKIFGKTHLQGRLSDGRTVAAVTGEAGVADIAMANPGKYIFTENDLLYGMPCAHLNTCALLNDLQYGDPQSNQWVSNHKLQIRHPMAVVYDDRWSAVAVSYGANADPREWTARWNDYSRPVVGTGVNQCQVAFETAATRPMLLDLYNRINAAEYAIAQTGDIILPPRPEYKAQPVEPLRPATWNGGEIVFPPVVNAPGDQPVAPVPPWAGTIGYENLPPADAVAQYVGPEPLAEIGVQWSRYIRRTRYPSGYNYYSHQGMVSLSAPGYLATLGAAWSGRSYVLGQVTWTKPSVTYPITYQVDDSISLVVSEKEHDPDEDSTPNTLLVSASRPGSGNGANLVLQTGKTYYFRLVYHGYGNPNYFHIRAHEAGHAEWSVRNAAANAYLANLAAHTASMQVWNEQVRAYQVYQEMLARSEQLLLQYQDWQSNYGRLLDLYETAYAEYLREKAIYDQYITELAAWNKANAEYQESIERWQRFRNARDAWVFLVEHRAAEPGVNWGYSDEPILQGYTFWKTQPECTCE